MPELPGCCLHFPESLPTPGRLSSVRQPRPSCTSRGFSHDRKSIPFLRTHLQVSVNDVLLVTILHRWYDLQRKQRNADDFNLRCSEEEVVGAERRQVGPRSSGRLGDNSQTTFVTQVTACTNCREQLGCSRHHQAPTSWLIQLVHCDLDAGGDGSTSNCICTLDNWAPHTAAVLLNAGARSYKGNFCWAFIKRLLICYPAEHL